MKKVRENLKDKKKRNRKMIKEIKKKTAQSRIVVGLRKRTTRILANEGGMELVQVAILIAIAIVVGLLFKDKIVEFINNIFENLSVDKFK